MVVFTICSNNLLLLLTQANIVSLNFVSTKRDKYLLTLNCTEAHVPQCNLRQITFEIFWLTFKKSFIMLYEFVKKG